MKILFLSQVVPYPPHGGVLQRGFNLIREIGRHCEVHLLAFVHPDVLPTEDMLEQSRAELGSFCKTLEYFALWPKASPLHTAAALAWSACSSQPFSVIAHRSSSYRARVAWHLNHSGIDLVHVDTLALAPYVPAARAYPAVLTHHNIESVLMHRRASVDRRFGARQFLAREAVKLQRAEVSMVGRFDANVVVSTHDLDSLRRLVPGASAAVVPNGVDIEYFAPTGQHEPTADLIYAGGMNMFANRDAVMYFVSEIWPRIVQRRSDARFVAVGQNPPRELLKCAEADPRIVVTGFVPDIRPFLGEAAVYVVPLRMGGGTRLKVLDAMASGKAMVSTSIGCEGIDATPGTHLLVADDPETFAASVLDLLSDQSRRSALGASARQFAESRYSWPIVGRALYATYENAVAVRRGGSRAAGVRT